MAAVISLKAYKGKISQDVFTRFADQGVVSAGNLLIGVLIARALGPANFGIFSLLWTVALFCISSHWACVASPMQSMPNLSQSAIRLEIFSPLLIFSLVIGVVGGLITLLAAVCLADKFLTLGGMLAIVMALTALLAQEFVRRWLLVTERPIHALYADSIRSIGTCCVLYVMIISGGSSIFEIFVVIGLFAFMGCIPIANDLAKASFGWGPSWMLARRNWAVGRWLLSFVSVQWAISVAPIYVLSIFMDSATAGGYRAAVYLISPIIVLTEAFETFLPLRCAAILKTGGVSAVNRILLRSTYQMLVITFAYSILVSIFSKYLLGSLFGPDYDEFHILVLLLACSAPLQNLCYIKNVQLRVMSAVRGVFVSEVIAGVLLILLYLVIPLGHYGQGAAAVVIATQAIKFVLLSWWARCPT